ncbi:YIP1 family protein [bacterium]|nr:YIP1 family protein [bacterium]
MSEVRSEVQELNAFQRIIAVFTSPGQAFESVDRKPSWFIPFLLFAVVVCATQFFVADIQINDRIALMEVNEAPQEQIDMVISQSEGAMRYVGLIFAPVGTLIFWVILAAIFLFAGNVIGGGESKFKKVFSMVCWGSLIGIVGMIVTSFLVYSRGSSYGVTTSLALLLPTPELGAPQSILYRIFKQLDIFAIWQNVVWVFGFTAIFKFTINKAITVVATLWGIWIVLSVVFGGLLSNFGM